MLDHYHQIRSLGLVFIFHSMFFVLPASAYTDPVDLISPDKEERIDRTQAPAHRPVYRTRTLRSVISNPPRPGKKIYRIEKFNQLFENIKSPFPIDLIKAIAWNESRWHHFRKDGSIVACPNYKKDVAGRPRLDRYTNKPLIASVDWGIMQINDKYSTLNMKVWNFSRIKTDPRYNIQAGITVLQNKLKLVLRMKKLKNWKQIEAYYNLTGYSDLVIAVKAYNGLQYSPIYINRLIKTLHQKPWLRAGAGGTIAGAAHYSLKFHRKNITFRRKADIKIAKLPRLPKPPKLPMSIFKYMVRDKPALSHYFDKGLGDVDPLLH
jgi:hypothetical protein